MDRVQALEKLTAAATAVDEAEAEMLAAAALDTVMSHPGLRYAPVDQRATRWVAACDGVLLGYLWSEPGRLLGGWTAARLDESDRLGPFSTGRAAAAALARHCGAAPAHTGPT
ncbi:hypothetical protein [Solwaraspora sp. WMMD792]|uniref:hypothetical protein n=1 Tax=Solwaraspora sp. WMMD792 TaxID=3016099 RepID=UPI0024175C8C|nr:hypothetical protein [Solwaraspora sp. WMMD792]MDG4768741.1 hypothetical protein [Solwaraspora sp. WMMD792]MDG4768780.1 hypothetical protein [Solwaraspora sp. WMMD792]MDG4768822.1 hypothetical protein [Solwaraspora sp. WMMD792]MDG4768865.1 hypothetical protein [Solwaraspora sp. WMMD792]MDG4768895.1 hypothetical protein [Solwaraspora sp. WMMD792]